MATYLQSLQASLHEAFTENEKVILFGEDILDPYGGAFKVTNGLSTGFPNRVYTTPISESSISGLSAGMALRGLLPVAEIMFGDFLTLCADQLINHISKFSAMYAGKVSVPLVIRTPMGGGRGYGPTHSQSIEKIFLGIPHLKVVAPSHFHQVGTLLKKAILNDSSPVLFIENKLLYPQELATSNEKIEVKFTNDFYPSAIIRNFKNDLPDVVLVSYGGTSRIIAPLLEELASEEINVTAFFPSDLKEINYLAIESDISNCGKVIFIEEGTARFNWGSEWASIFYEKFWQKLNTPIKRLASEEDIIPTASHLEEQMLISKNKIEMAIMEILG